MANHFQGLVFLVFCVVSGSSIRMQRDFSYPSVEEFNVFWNVPSSSCQKHGINFEKHTSKFGIIANPGDSFRGSFVSILYDPGAFPAMVKSGGRLIERNGGIPQLGNLTFHLEAFKKYLEDAVPQDFRGVGVIDFEAWRPILRQNWNGEAIYKTLSKELERQRHPQWRDDQIEYAAAYNFEVAARTFFETTLQLAKLLRPRGVWGYYAFPYCFNFRKGNEAKCTDTVEVENDRIQWLFDESTAIYPSIYMSSKLNAEDQKKFVIGRLNEAWRVASRVPNRRLPGVYPYIWYKYHDSANFMTEADMYTALETTRRYKMGGAIIWGASENVTGKEKCQALLNYLNNVLGPAVVKVRQNRNQQQETQFGFVHIPLIPQLESSIINKINQTIHPPFSSDEESSPTTTTTTTTLSPALQNYYNWYKLYKTFF